MRNTAVAFLCMSCFLLAGCGDEPAQEATPAGQSAEASDASAVSEAAQAFVIAQEGALSGRNPQLPSPAEMRSAVMPAGYTLGQPTVTGDEAAIVLRVEEGAVVSDVSLSLRRENGRWVVRSTTHPATPGNPALTMYWKTNPQGEIEFDLEAAKANPAPDGQPLVSITNETPADKQPPARTPQTPPSPVVSINQFEEFGFASRESFEKTWQIDVNIADRPLGEVLAELTEPYDLEIRARQVGEDILDQPVSIQLAGVSRVEAMDAVCRQVGVYPDFAGGVYGGLGSRVSLMSGQRPGVSTYAGPFLVTLEDAGQPLSRDTASVRATLFALGLSWPGLVAEGRDLLQITEVLDAEGNCLLDTEAYEPHRAKARGEGGNLLVKADLPLRGVAEGATIQSLRGVSQAALLTEEHELQFETYSPGARQAAGPLEIVWQSDGIFEVVGATREFTREQMQVECYDADGGLTESMGQSFNRFNTKVHVSEMVTQAPARATVRVVTRTGLVEYPVELMCP
ncbi:MAG: hypothetical protein GY851_33220 [bacterium]|nr:hypothetical protein [bacterium]